MKRLSWLTLAIATLLVAGACGRSGSSGGGGGTTTTAPPAAASAGDFGTLKAVCGPGTAKGATDKFVTDTSIDVGTMADPGAAASPGLDQELFDTATAFVNWCNAAGGVLGRQLVLHKHDAKLFEVSARMLDSCNQDFALVGDGMAFDDQGVDARVGCQLPEIPAYDNSPKASSAPLKVQADPLPTNQAPAYPWLGVQHMFPGTTKVAFITGALKGVLLTRDRYKEAAETTGMTTVYNESYPITGPDNWRPLVQRMKDSGAEVVMETGDAPQLVGMEKAMSDINWYPKVIIEAANQYDNRIIKEGGTAIQNTWVFLSYYPFEEAKDNPPTQQYLDIMAKYNPGGKIAALGLNAMSAWLLFATSARDCGSNLTRTCLLDKAGANPAYTAGGLKAPVSTDPVNRQAAQCYMAMKATSTAFQRDPNFLRDNQSIYNCSPSNVVHLKGNYTG